MKLEKNKQFESDLTNRYLVRGAEPRKIRLINKYIDKTEIVLDLGCGNGLYASYLKDRCKILIGLDSDAVLAKHCLQMGVYDDFIIDQVPPIKLGDNSVNTVFASEVLEHVSVLLPLQNEIERVTKDMVVATIPNPIYSFFYDDPTHILKYTICSIVKDMNKNSNKFIYKSFGLGFENIPGGKLIRRISQLILYYFPKISPTVAIVGTRKK